jgi:uncharacterized membrane protein required for colicin V production
MNPFGSSIYVLGFLFVLAAGLIGYGTYSADAGWAVILGALIGVGLVAFILYVLSNARFT